MPFNRVAVPIRVKERIFARVVTLAEAHGYLHQKRPANGRFIENLVLNPEVGQRLLEYIDRTRVKSYVKDCLIKDYVRQARALSPDLATIVTKEFQGAEYLEKEREIYKFKYSGELLLVIFCTFKHWELGAKKLALKASQFGPRKKPEMVLLIRADGYANGGDKKQAEEAIELIGMWAIWI